MPTVGPPPEFTDAEREAYQKERESLYGQIENAQYRYEELIERTLERLQQINPEITAISEYWDCRLSPVGMCVYNEDEDPMRDSCLYCGDPEERK